MNKRVLYNQFIEGLAISEDEYGNPIGIREAKKMYSFNEYVYGGAYDDDLEYLEGEKRRKR